MEFSEWISESAIVDPDGQPLRVYHGSYHPNPAMSRLTHFGTASAASNRLFDLSYRQNNSTMVGGKIYSGYLRITRPFTTMDCWSENPIGYGGSVLFKFADSATFTTAEIEHVLLPLEDSPESGQSNLMQKIFNSLTRRPAHISDQEVHKLYTNDYKIYGGAGMHLKNTFDDPILLAKQHRCHVATGRFVRLLQSKGFDGIRYRNDEEGGISYVVFDANQIWLDDKHYCFKKTADDGHSWMEIPNPDGYGKPVLNGKRADRHNRPQIKDKAILNLR